MGIIYIKIPRGDMMDKRIKCDPEILFKITKKEADFVFKLPKRLQDDFEDYQKLRYKFNCLRNGMFNDVVNKTESSFDPSFQKTIRL